MKIGIVIPAHDEVESVANVVDRCRSSAQGLGSVRIIVCDNDSTDGTADRARSAGAEVVFASPRGYGRACLAAIAQLGDWPDILVFVDADGSSRPEQIADLLEPIREGAADLVIGFRPFDSAMTLPQRLGTRLATRLLALRWAMNPRDLGPFRAIVKSAYDSLGMSDRTWGWTLEMQVLAHLRGLRTAEVPVAWDPRQAGTSKISGTVLGVVRAGGRILWTIFRLAFRSGPGHGNVPDWSFSPRQSGGAAR